MAVGLNDAAHRLAQWTRLFARRPRCGIGGASAGQRARRVSLGHGGPSERLAPPPRGRAWTRSEPPRAAARGVLGVDGGGEALRAAPATPRRSDAPLSHIRPSRFPSESQAIPLDSRWPVFRLEVGGCSQIVGVFLCDDRAGVFVVGGQRCPGSASGRPASQPGLLPRRTGPAPVCRPRSQRGAGSR